MFAYIVQILAWLILIILPFILVPWLMPMGAAGKYPQTDRSNRVAISAANAGQRTGTGASTGIAGVASGNTRLAKLRLAMTASLTVNTVLRVYKYDGTNYALLFEVPISITVPTIGGSVVWSTVLGSDDNPLGITLPNTSTTMRYNMETADAIVITEEVLDFV